MKKYIGFLVVLALVGFITATTSSCNKQPLIKDKPIFDTVTTGGGGGGGGGGGTNYTTGTLVVTVRQFTVAGSAAPQATVALALTEDSVYQEQYVRDDGVTDGNGQAVFSDMPPRRYYVYAKFTNGGHDYTNDNTVASDTVTVRKGPASKPTTFQVVVK